MLFYMIMTPIVFFCVGLAVYFIHRKVLPNFIDPWWKIVLIWPVVVVVWMIAGAVLVIGSIMIVFSKDFEFKDIKELKEEIQNSFLM
jgi:hypothetical protein